MPRGLRDPWVDRSDQFWLKRMVNSSSTGDGNLVPIGGVVRCEPSLAHGPIAACFRGAGAGLSNGGFSPTRVDGTCADFCGQIEADVEDLFDPDLFVEMLNGAYKPPADKVVTAANLAAAATTPRIVKKAEALFKLMPASVNEFDHFGAARWLLENPAVLDADTPAVAATLDRAEAVFKAFNELLN